MMNNKKQGLEGGDQDQYPKTAMFEGRCFRVLFSKFC